MRYLALLGLLFFAVLATADEKQHMTLALQFDALTNSASKPSLADALILEAVKNHPSLGSHKEQLKLFLVKALESEEYQNEKARAYMEVFSEVELVQLVEMAQSPGYQILQRKRNAMALGLILSTTNIARRKLPEFEKSIESNGEKQ